MGTRPLLIVALVPGTSIAARRHTVDLGARADFVAQTNFVQCVGASMQMMLNMINPNESAFSVKKCFDETRRVNRKRSQPCSG